MLNSSHNEIRMKEKERSNLTRAPDNKNINSNGKEFQSNKKPQQTVDEMGR